MDFKEEFEARVKRLESFIEEKGLGSKQLNKAKKVQRTMNTIVFVGSLITIAGIALWQISKDKE